jgi:hypothetical protein
MEITFQSLFDAYVYFSMGLNYGEKKEVRLQLLYILAYNRFCLKWVLLFEYEACPWTHVLRLDLQLVALF